MKCDGSAAKVYNCGLAGRAGCLITEVLVVKILLVCHGVHGQDTGQQIAHDEVGSALCAEAPFGV